MTSALQDLASDQLLKITIDTVETIKDLLLHYSRSVRPRIVKSLHRDGGANGILLCAEKSRQHQEHEADHCHYYSGHKRD